MTPESSQAAAPLNLTPPAPAGKRLNKRLVGVVMIVGCCVIGLIVWALKARADAVAPGAVKTATGEPPPTIQAVSPVEAATTVANLQAPVRTPSSPAPASTDGGPVAHGDAYNHSSAAAPANAVPPKSSPSSRLIDGSYFNAPGGSGGRPASLPPIGGGSAPGSASQRTETAAEEAARLEHEALYGHNLSAGKRDAKQSADANSPIVQPGDPALPAVGGSNDLAQIAAIAKSLIPQGATPPAAAPPQPAQPVAQGIQASGGGIVDAIQRRAENDTLNAIRTAALSPYEIKAGWDIPAILEQGLTSELAGEIRALVAQNVRDTVTGKDVLLPQGARLLGTYNEKTAYGQNRIPVAWTRIIFPDGSSLDLDGMTGQDARGYAGLSGKTDNHYRGLIGAVVLSSMLSAVTSLATNRSGGGLGYYPSPQQGAEAGAAQSINDTGAQIVRRNLHLQPTIIVPAGTRFNVHVDKDIRFDGPYRARPPLLPQG